MVRWYVSLKEQLTALQNQYLKRQDEGMINFIIIGLCIAAGMFFRYSGKLPKDAHKGLNAWIINLGLPAFSFKYLPAIEWRKELLLPALAPILVWLCGWLFVSLYAKTQKGMSKATQGGLKLVAALCNTSFVGFPLIVAYFSEKELGIAIISDQVTFLLLSTLGIIVAIRSAQHQELKAGLVINKLLKFPPFIACLAALILPHFIDFSALNPLFEKLAATVGPLALFSIGLQLKFAGWKGELKHIAAVLLYKLILAPAIVLSVIMLIGANGIVPEISVFEMAMPTLLTSGIIADQYNLNPKLVNLVIGIGIVTSFFTTAIWYVVLGYCL